LLVIKILIKKKNKLTAVSIVEQIVVVLISILKPEEIGGSK